MSRELANLISSRFIARTDVKAIQYPNSQGDIIYSPVREKWTRQDLEDHLDGIKTFGHYLVSPEDECKVICFDIDLEMSGFLPTTFQPEVGPGGYKAVEDLRAAWHTRNHPARGYMKVQFRDLSNRIAAQADRILNAKSHRYDIMVSYSGNKGIHVYVLPPKKQTAKVLRDAAFDILGSMEMFEDRKNSGIFFHSSNQDPDSGFPNLSIELFPKQDSVNKEGLGNLLRLPLGRNLKHSDPTFFVDMSAPINTLVPVDPIRALTPGYNMWQTPEEAKPVSTVGSVSLSPA